MEMLQLKMLNSQKRNLKDRIQKLKDSIETQKRHEMYKVRELDLRCTRGVAAWKFVGQSTSLST